MEVRKLRYISMGKVDALTYWAALDFIRTLEPSVIVSGYAEKDAVLVGRNAEWNTYYYPEKFPPDLVTFRDPRVSPKSYLVGPDTLLYGFLVPSADKEELRSAILEIVAHVLKRKGLNVYRSKHRPFANDLVFEKDGKQKKFIGVAVNNSRNNIYMSFGLTLSWNRELAEQIFKTGRGAGRIAEAKKISDIVGGLREVKPDIELADDEIAKEFAERFNLEFVREDFTSEEMKEISEIAEAIRDPEWIWNRKPPKVKEKFRLVERWSPVKDYWRQIVAR